MDLDSVSFDPPTVALIGRVCDEVWLDLERKQVFVDTVSEFEMRRLIVRKLIAAVADGERDPERLKSLALRSVLGGAV